MKWEEKEDAWGGQNGVQGFSGKSRRKETTQNTEA
jgi:hypothetical protein